MSYDIISCKHLLEEWEDVLYRLLFYSEKIFVNLRVICVRVKYLLWLGIRLLIHNILAGDFNLPDVAMCGTMCKGLLKF